MSNKQFIVKVFTPKGKVLEKSTEFLRLPGKSGDIGVYYDHTPSLVECIEGEMALKTSNHTHAFFLQDALVKIDKEDVVVIVNNLEPIENIDKNRAESSKERALTRIDQARTDTAIDLDRAKESLKRAEIRLDIIEKHHLN
ncbi:MAG: ATP synthase F1 subunit epsilon [Candidatus Margulisiibacteriota bacterium]